MASPVDTSVKHYRSDMPGAPVLNGQVGSKIAQLDACLVTGYGLKSATSLVVVGGIATLTFDGGASAAWPDAVILVTGASNAALNGEQKVLTANATTVTFATAQAAGTDAGTVTFKIAPAGWEKVFSGTNKAVYRGLSVESSGMYFVVTDTTTVTVDVQGFELMTSVDAGTGPIGGGLWAKTDAVSANPVMWIIASDGRFVIDSTAPGSHRGSSYRSCAMRGFGDFIPKNPAGDAYLVGVNYDAANITGTARQYHCLDSGSDPSTKVARGITGLGGAVAMVIRPYSGSSNFGISGSDSTMGAFPSPVDGSLILSKRFLSESVSAPPRGDVPGVFYSPQSGLFSTFPMFSGIVFEGRKLLCSNPGFYLSSFNSVYQTSQPSSSNTGVSFIDITGPWR